MNAQGYFLGRSTPTLPPESFRDLPEPADWLPDCFSLFRCVQIGCQIIFPSSAACGLALRLYFPRPLRADWLPDYFSLFRCVRMGSQIIFPSSAACGLAPRLYFPRPLRADWLPDYISLVRCARMGSQIIFLPRAGAGPANLFWGLAPHLYPAACSKREENQGNKSKTPPRLTRAGET